jgi:hypothetical protein
MSAKIEVQDLQDKIIRNIKETLASYPEDTVIQFNSPFGITLLEEIVDVEVWASYEAKDLKQDGTVIYDSYDTTGEEIPLERLTIYELAHINDILVTHQFELAT